MTHCDSPGFIGITIASMLGCAIAMGGCRDVGRMEKKLDQLLKQQPVTAVCEERTENVFGDITPEKYFLINGQKAYTQVDGKNIQTYFVVGRQ